MRFLIDVVRDELLRVAGKGWLIGLSGSCGLGRLVHIAIRPTRDVTAPLPIDGHQAIRAIEESVQRRELVQACRGDTSALFAYPGC
ncbi:MAG TPA: hypothetical protein VLA67_09010 [Nitrospiraceae bacterium]|nr:hypothetical protein [Nitrospiraceae bacterium]